METSKLDQLKIEREPEREPSPVKWPLLIVAVALVAGNTMAYTVRERTNELAVLKAIGFTDQGVLGLILGESLALTLVGGIIGLGLAWLAFDGYRAATLSWTSFSAITFAFDVNAKLLVQGIIFAMIIGLIGGLFPAIRAARQPVAQSLREL